MPRKPAVNEAAVIAFRDAAEFEAWLDVHAGLRAGVWLKIAKQASGVPSLTGDEAVDLGLCYGWISGQRKSCDEVYYLQKYVPRRPRSRWSQVNVARVEELIAAGRMRPSGLAEVEAAKADGRWAAAYQSQRNASVPPDLAAALAASPQAAQAFGALSKTQRYAVILKLVTARTATARAARLRTAMTALEPHLSGPAAGVLTSVSNAREWITATGSKSTYATRAAGSPPAPPRARPGGDGGGGRGHDDRRQVVG